jgi:hypothetical protein
MSGGGRVLSADELRQLFDFARAVTEGELARINASLAPPRRRRSLVLDFEFRRVAEGWPALRAGRREARFVVKQVRPLEPSPRVSGDLRGAPIPHDVLARARRIERTRCKGDGAELEALLVYTDRNLLPDLGFSEHPLLSGVKLSVGASAGIYTHLDMASSHTGPDGLSATFRSGAPHGGFAYHDGQLSVIAASGAVTRTSSSCTTSLEHAEPTELLRSYVSREGG